MGYDLSLCTVSDEQLEHLRANAGHTRDFIEGRRPKTTTTEKVGSWFSKRELVKEVDVEVGCVWPDSKATCTMLYSRGGLYFVLNGTTAKVDGATNFPSVGGRYRGETLGSAVELGEVGVGHAHAFRAAQVVELRAALRDMDVPTVEERARTYALETGTDEDELAQEAQADIKSLCDFLDRACAANLGMMWFWG